MTTPCEGPLIWFACGDRETDDCAAILECARPDCDYVIITGSFHDAAHSNTPLLREGFAS